MEEKLYLGKEIVWSVACSNGVTFKAGIFKGICNYSVPCLPWRSPRWPLFWTKNSISILKLLMFRWQRWVYSHILCLQCA